MIYLFQEYIIIITIISFLFFICFQKIQNKNFQFEEVKKNFYLLNRFLICILSFLQIINFYQFSSGFLFPQKDYLIFNSFFNFLINDSFGNFFFRQDYLTVFFNILLTFLFLFYLCLLQYIMRQTYNNYKYLLEIPLLLLVIFFSFRIFLITYDLMLIILTLELAAFCSVILIGLQVTTKENIFPLEAAIKYFIFNALAVALLLFAISGYYLLFKTINLLDFSLAFLCNPSIIFFNNDLLLLFHFIFFLAYFLKLGAAPFHQWVPDVYEGAELLMTAFLVLIVSPILLFKLFIFIKLLLPIFEIKHYLFLFFLLVGFLSLIMGTFNAFLQFKIKRFLAYTGITHLGYILLSLGTASYLGFFASFFYLIIYIITNLIFFSLLLILRQITGFSLLYFSHFKLIFNQNIFLSFFFIIPLLSYAGFPPFLGFFAKFFIIITLLDFNQFFLTCLLIFYIIINAYLYLRIIKFSFFEFENLHYFLPLTNIKNFSSFYLIKINLKNTKTIIFKKTNILFFIFFFNIILIFGGFFLPQILNFFYYPLLTLFLFY